MRGFTLPEALVATLLSMLVSAAVFLVVQPSHHVLQAQLESADLQQRLRYAVDAISRDLTMAEEVLPYRAGLVGDDPAAGVFFRPDVLTARHAAANPPGGWVSRTYYLRPDGSGEAELMQYDGGLGDFPMIDGVVSLAFAYFGVGGDGVTLVPFEAAALTDGPWWPHAAAPDRVDTDVRRIRRVRVQIRLQAGQASVRGPAGALFARAGRAPVAARYVPDREIRFDAAPRNTAR